MLVDKLLLLLQIMGVGYYKQLSQWSKGEYSGANNVSARRHARYLQRYSTTAITCS
jgi:hypothetical protein